MGKTLAPAAHPAPARVSFLIVPRFNMATVITMIEVMRIANYLAPNPLYSWEILSFDGVQINASNGLSLAASPPTVRSARRMPRKGARWVTGWTPSPLRCAPPFP